MGLRERQNNLAESTHNCFPPCNVRIDVLESVCMLQSKGMTSVCVAFRSDSSLSDASAT